MDRFAFVTYFRHTQDSFQHLFIKGWRDDYFISYYSRNEVIDAVNFAKERVSVKFYSSLFMDHIWNFS